ncbi:transcriptional regulator [Spirochaetia bacterium]|nr:transcriptional regulator [Spirochaetia bacterium]
MVNPTDYTENMEEIEAQIRQIAVRLREERERARISQMDLSYLAGLSQNQVHYIETGKRTPNLYTILKICAALQISPAVLFNPADEQRQKTREMIISLITRYI